jgi:hypothetical protein
VDRLTEVARITKLTEYLASYPALQGSHVTLEDAADAVRESRRAS